MTDKASIRPDMVEAAKAEVLWALRRWQSTMTPFELTDTLFEGPALSATLSHAFIERMAALEAENARLREALKTADLGPGEGNRRQAIKSHNEQFIDGNKDDDAENDGLEECGNWSRTDPVFRRAARTTLQEHAEDGGRQGDEG
jgi:hypothetical protein